MTVVFRANQKPPHPPPRPLVDPGNKLMLFWMHRCGSTTGQRWFFELAGWKDRMSGRGAAELSAMWHAEHPDAYKNLDELCRDPSFIKVAVVRQPLIRAVSAFTVITDTKSGAQWKAVAKSLEAPDPERRLTFLEFLDFLEGENLETANYHWRLQTAQDWHELPPADVHVVRLEAIQVGLDNVCRLLGKRRVPLRINSAQSTCRTKIPQQDIVNFTRKDFARAFGYDKRGIIRFPEYSKFLTAEAVQRLVSLYERDFARLGYEPGVPPEPGRASGYQRLLQTIRPGGS
jgi:hypothetical protein